MPWRLLWAIVLPCRTMRCTRCFPPEGFASILWKDRTRAAEAAAVMKMSAHEACEMGLIEEVVSEGEGPAHENPEQAAAHVEEYVVRSLRELYSLSPEELREQRYQRFRAF